MRSILLLQFACTLLMTGIIWFVQVVHYPLFVRIPAQGFALYEAQHATRTGWVVGPLMCAELLSAAFFLLQACRPTVVPTAEAWLGAALLFVLWLSTACIQVPLHNRLAAGYDSTVIARLVATNWIRTMAWTLRAVLVIRWAAMVTR